MSDTYKDAIKDLKKKSEALVAKVEVDAFLNKLEFVKSKRNRKERREMDRYLKVNKKDRIKV